MAFSLLLLLLLLPSLGLSLWCKHLTPLLSLTLTLTLTQPLGGRGRGPFFLPRDNGADLSLPPSAGRNGATEIEEDDRANAKLKRMVDGCNRQ